MRIREVASTNLKTVAYDRKCRVLYIEFQSGHKYSYDDVSYYRYLKLMKANSHGSYFYYHIRMSYKYTRIL